jgi:ribonucleoside-diphosphate reductase alpha chain
MYKIKNNDFEIKEYKPEEPLDHVTEQIAVRPGIVNAKVYKLRSGFVKHSVYITLGYIEQNGRQRPIEIFINSKDLTKNAEYAVLTRLISAIFRKSANPSFILEELSSIHDPNGGYYKNGKYIHSVYSEIADVIEQFFHEIGIMGRPKEIELPEVVTSVLQEPVGRPTLSAVANSQFKICPDCSERSVKLENGCETCINPKCGYSKCDK